MKRKFKQLIAWVKYWLIKLLNIYYATSAQIAADKKLHYFMAYFIADMGTNIWDITIGSSIGTGFVILKEIMDKASKEHGNAELQDMVYGLLGIATRVGMYYGFD